ncbi:hypothetical protein Btru_074586 [Bulinus truncatus]|nr:hypothetical protein Btru_074586 [Bulinus truncatus]
MGYTTPFSNKGIKLNCPNYRISRYMYQTDRPTNRQAKRMLKPSLTSENSSSKIMLAPSIIKDSTSSKSSEKFSLQVSKPSSSRSLTRQRSPSNADRHPSLSFKISQRLIRDSNRKLVKVVEADDRRKRSKIHLAMKKFDNMDETCKVFQSRPRTEPGSDVRSLHETTEQEHNRLMNELRLKKMANDIRQKSLLDKTALLQLNIKMFDSFIRDIERRYTRALFQITKNRMEMVTMEEQRIKMINIIERINEIHDKRDLLDKRHPVLDYMNSVVAVSGFYKKPYEMLNRFYAMKSNLQTLMVKYEADLDTEDKLLAEERELIKESQESTMFLRTKIILLKQHLNELRCKNLQNSVDVSHLMESAEHEYVLIYTIKAAIYNLSNMIANFRPFLQRKIARVGRSWKSQIEEIGKILTFYEELVVSLKPVVLARRQHRSQGQRPELRAYEEEDMMSSMSSLHFSSVSIQQLQQ